MTLAARFTSRMRVGLAVGAEALTAARLERSGRQKAVWSRPMPPPEDTAAYWRELSSAAHEMAQALEVLPGRVFLALLPPLVQLRRIELPRLRETDLSRILVRDAGKYFIGAAGPQAIAVARLESRRRSPQPLLVAAALEWLVSGLARVLESAGWVVEAVGPAHAAWASATVPSRPADPGLPFIVPGPRSKEVLCREGGRLVDVRRVPSSGFSSEVGTALEHSEAIAALNASRVGGMELVPLTIGTARAEWRSALARRLWLTTAAVVLVTLGFLRLDLKHETARVEAARLGLHDAVGRAMTAREAVEDLRSRLAVLRDAEATAPRWSTVLGTVAEHLPRDAYLSGFRGDQDSLGLEGTASHAIGVFEALKRAPGFAGVQARAPIRQETGDSQQTIERFSLAAWLGSVDSVRAAQ